MGPRGSGRRWAPGVGTGDEGHRGAHHWAVGGEGAAGKRLLLVVGSDLAPLPRGAAWHPMEMREPVAFILSHLLATRTWK